MIVRIHEGRLFSRIELQAQTEEEYSNPMLADVAVAGIKEALTVYNKDGDPFTSFYPEGVHGIAPPMSFLKGHTERLCTYLAGRGIGVEFYPADLIEQRQSPPDFTPPVGELIKLQPWAVENIVKHQYGIMSLCTRFGKSYVYAGMYVALGRPRTMMIAKTVTIAEQVSRELAKWLGEPVGVVSHTIGKTAWHNFNVGIAKSFYPRNSSEIRPEYRPLLGGLEMLIVDECHSFGSQIQSLYHHMPELIWSWGGSATPFTKEVEQQFLLEGYAGPVRIEAKAKLLSDYGYVAKLNVFWYRFKHSTPEPNAKYHDLITKHIVFDERRNQLIASIAYGEMDAGGQGIIFVDRVEHGKELCSLIPGSVFVSSTTMNRSTSNDTLRQFNNREIPVVITTKKWREGVTFRADYGINAEGANADHVTIQKVGRPLMPKEDLSAVRWYEIWDHGLQPFERWSQTRYACLRDEEWPQSFVE